jgi:hypothetical protein
MKYSTVHAKFWRDERIRALPEDARTLFLYLLTSPHRTALGFYYLPIAYVANDLQWIPERVKEAFRNCFDTHRDGYPMGVDTHRDGYPMGVDTPFRPLFRYDEQAGVVLIPNFLTYNPLRNVNHAKGALAALSELPNTPLWQDFWRIVETLPEPIRDCFDTHRDGYPMGVDTHRDPVPVPVPVLDLDQDLKRVVSCVTTPDTPPPSASKDPITDSTDDVADPPTDSPPPAKAKTKRTRTKKLDEWDTPADAFLIFFCLRHDEVHKTAYRIPGARYKALSAVKARLKGGVSVEDLQTAAELYLQSDEPFVVRKGWDFWPFASDVSGWLHRARGGRVPGRPSRMGANFNIGKNDRRTESEYDAFFTRYDGAKEEDKP